MTNFAQQVDELIAMTGETLDEELLDETHKLHALAVEADDIDKRFHAQMAFVQAILKSRIVSSDIAGNHER